LFRNKFSSLVSITTEISLAIPNSPF
jgi:hypothetical protein